MRFLIISYAQILNQKSQLPLSKSWLSIFFPFCSVLILSGSALSWENFVLIGSMLPLWPITSEDMGSYHLVKTERGTDTKVSW